MVIKSTEDVQAKTFRNWYATSHIVPLLATRSNSCLFRLNQKLESRNIPPMTNLAKDFSDGVRLIQLMEVSFRHLLLYDFF